MFTSFDEYSYKGFGGKLMSTHVFSSGAVYYTLLGVIVLMCLALPYFIGSVNFGVIVSKKKYGEDVRTKGSGNAGSTNIFRTYGAGAAALTFAGDFLKGALSAALGICIFGWIGGFTGALGCMLGHAYPIYFGFKGGKGVATSAGAILVLDPFIFLILIISFVLIVWWTKFISLGSVTAAFLFPLLHSRMNVGKMPGITVVISLLIGGFIIYLHRSNIKRIYRGEESKFSFKKKESGGEDESGNAK